MEKRIKYIGLDVHKNSIAIADQGRDQEVRFSGLKMIAALTCELNGYFDHSAPYTVGRLFRFNSDRLR
jgi:hypothetical protein